MSYSDIACETKLETTAPQSAAKSPTTGAARDVPIVPAEAVAPTSSLDRKLQELMTLTQLSARVIRRVVQSIRSTAGPEVGFQACGSRPRMLAGRR